MGVGQVQGRGGRGEGRVGVRVSGCPQSAWLDHAMQCAAALQRRQQRGWTPGGAHLAADGACGVVALQDGLAAGQAVEVLAGCGHTALAAVARRPAAVAAQCAALLHRGSGVALGAAERLGGRRGCGDGGLVHSQRWLPLLLLQLQLLPAAALALNALTLGARR